MLFSELAKDHLEYQFTSPSQPTIHGNAFCTFEYLYILSV